MIILVLPPANTSTTKDNDNSKNSNNGSDIEGIWLK